MNWKAFEKLWWPSDKLAVFFLYPAFIGFSIAIGCASVAMTFKVIPIAFLAAIGWILIGNFVFYPRWHKKWLNAMRGGEVSQLSLFQPKPCACGAEPEVYQLPNYPASEWWKVGCGYRCPRASGKSDAEAVNNWNEQTAAK